MPHSAALCAVVWLGTLPFFARAVSAQIPSAGDLDPKGRVFAKIQVTIADSGEFRSPVSALNFLAVTEIGQRTEIRTDDAGIASAWLSPATYRFVSRQPVPWKGRAYTWDVLVSVSAGMGVIKLSEANAIAVTAAKGTLGEANPDPKNPTPSSGQGLDRGARTGFWFNAGLGYGSLTCSGCDGYFGGISGGVSAGATLNLRMWLGLGATGWTKSEAGVSLTTTTLDARLRFYPSATRNFFLTGGLGAGTIRAQKAGIESTSENGIASILGAGMDFHLANNLSVTPFWNSLVTKTSNADARVGQFGLGLTIQ